MSHHNPLAFAALWVALLALMSPVAHAHKASDSFIYISPDEGHLRVDLALRDLALLVSLDRNGDQAVSGAEVRAARPAITRTVEQGVMVSNAGGPCRLTGQRWGISEHSDGNYAAADYRIDCADGGTPDTLRYSLLFHIDPLHRALVSIEGSSGSRLAVFGPETGEISLGTRPPSPWQTFLTFVHQGVLHLLMGMDHLFFLLVLAIPATLGVRAATGSRRALGLTARLKKLAGIATAFTVAHSITLALSALNIVNLPSAWVETAIALSITVTAINVIWPVLGERTWLLAFGFGLVHGFGFASVLSDLTSGQSELASALAGFNIGVELGQIGLLLVGFPLLYALAHRPVYERAMVPIMLAVVGVTSLVWAGQRVPLPGWIG